VLTADEVPTPMQVGVGTELIIEEAAGSSFQFLVLTADHEVLAAPVQAGASTNLPVWTADQVPTPFASGRWYLIFSRGGGRVLISISGFNCR
jgi:hypothetical protein